MDDRAKLKKGLPTKASPENDVSRTKSWCPRVDATEVENLATVLQF